MIFVKHLGNELNHQLYGLVEDLKASYDLTVKDGFKSMSEAEDAYRSGGTITYADYFNDQLKNTDGVYRQLLINGSEPLVKEVADHFFCNSWTHHNMWFHEYHQGDSFEWHTHKGSHYTCVYFIELPDGAGTELMGHEVDVKEGDMIMFPSIIPHRSPPLFGTEVKKIIGWTMTFHYI